MFAVIKTGGKQYRVEENSLIRIEKIDAREGATVTLSDVLMTGNEESIKIGLPTVAGATVEATVVRQMRDRKVLIFKKNRRHNYRRKRGHRQHLTVLRVTKINAA
ncbi:MAG: 50S ribosomal protein L21 [Holosporales bacterium]